MIVGLSPTGFLFLAPTRRLSFKGAEKEEQWELFVDEAA
jgi:hypothetical protein